MGVVRYLMPAMLGLGLSMAPASDPAFGRGRQSRTAEPLCRRPAALPAMAPEPVAILRGTRSESAPVAMAPPPPPPETMVPPSPPPRPSETTSPAAPPAGVSDEDRSVMVTGSRMRRPDLESAAPITTITGPITTAPGDVTNELPAMSSASSPPARRAASGGTPQSGQLTAGDYDDLLNPELYASYVRTMVNREAYDEVPLVNTRRILTVLVQDEAGRPIPFADVTLTCADGNRLTLATLADGTAVFFPEFDRLGRNVGLSVAGAEAGSDRQVGFTSQAGSQQQTVTLPDPAPRVARFDLAVVLDTTGSMSDELEYLKSELRTILADIARAHPELDIRLALVAYRDEGDEYVTRTFPFTGEFDRIQEGLRAQRADGGGDTPEAMDQALGRALALDWRPDAVRTLLLVADAPPHPENVTKTWAAAEVARARRIQIVPVAASGVEDLAQYMMRAMAAATQSRYLFLTDDSGIGNPHAEPSVDCYLVTRLDRLVWRVLDSQISGRRVEPRDGEIIRTVGTYDQGRCVLPRDFRVED
jgi:hypothetical protein